MQVIASLLDTKADQTVRKLWDVLETECKLKGIKSTPIPHITWQIAENYDPGQLNDKLKMISQESIPFDIYSNGLGLFTGKKLVLFLNIVVTKKIVKFHENIWDNMQSVSASPNMVYEPGKWIPHVTLAYNDLTDLNVNCAIQAFQNWDLRMTIRIDNICILYSIENQAGIHSTYNFKEQNQSSK